MTARLPADERVGEMLEARFGDLRIAYDERVLTPRAWTAEQSAWAADLLPEVPTGPVLELCCGAGHIGLLAVQGSVRDLVQVDLDPVACTFARLNADRVRPRGCVEIRNTSLETATGPGERFALVIADPPYLPHDEISVYPDDPELAVDGGPDGLDVVWACLEVIRVHLAAGGQSLMQLRDGYQAEVVRNRLAGGELGDLRLLECRAVGASGVLCRLAHVEMGSGSVADEDARR
jgi:methylase of polypeptide subunit release factors